MLSPEGALVLGWGGWGGWGGVEFIFYGFLELVPFLITIVTGLH